MNKYKRSLNVDLVRVTAMILVIFMHTLLSFTFRPDFFNTPIYFFLTPIMAVSKTCIQLFLMLSGYLVIYKSRTIKQNLIHLKKRLLIPWFFFWIFTIIHQFAKFNFSENNFKDFILIQFKRVTDYPSSFLWFLEVLIFLYLLNPIWNLIFRPKTKPDLAKYLTLIFLIISISSEVLKFPGQKVDTIFNIFTSWIGFAFFYLYGGLVRNRWIDISNQNKNKLMIILGVGITIVLDHIAMYQRVNNINFLFNTYSGGYLNFSVILAAVGLFNYLITLNLSGFKSKILTFLANSSFGVYLFHTFVVGIFTDFTNFSFDKLNLNVWLYNFINTSLVLGISLLLTTIIKKIPKLRIIIGELS